MQDAIFPQLFHARTHTNTSYTVGAAVLKPARKLWQTDVRGLLEKYPTVFFMRTPDGL